MSPDAWSDPPAPADDDADADAEAPSDAAADSDGAWDAAADGLAPVWLLLDPQAAAKSASAESRARPLERVGMRSSSCGRPARVAAVSSGVPIPRHPCAGQWRGSGLPTLPWIWARPRCERPDP